MSSVLAGGSASVQGYAQTALAVSFVTVINLRPHLRPFVNRTKDTTGMKSFLIIIPAMALGTFQHIQAQERTAGGALQTEASWAALKNLIGVVGDKTKIAQITATAALELATRIRNCGNKGMLYAPDNGGNDDGCITTGGGRTVSVGAPFNVTLAGDISQQVGIPLQATFLKITTTCFTKHADTQIEANLSFQDTETSLKDALLCRMTGVTQNQTLLLASTKYIPLPQGATRMTLSRKSSGTGNKSVEISGVFLMAN